MNNHDVAANLTRTMLTRVQEERGVLTPEDISAKLDEVLGSGLVRPMDAAARDSLVRELQSQYETVIGSERELLGDDDDGWEPWLDRCRENLDWTYSERYSKYLSEIGFNTPIIERLDHSTDRILGYIGDPKKDTPWDRRGLVVGLVQSGKTANYLGLVNKAVDAGYKVIIILTGFTEGLRAQTQRRMEHGVIGRAIRYDKKERKIRAEPCGVGMIPPKPVMDIDCVTTESDDFKASIAKHLGIAIGGEGSRPILFVVKKNATVLKHLLAWAHSFADPAADGSRFVRNAPLLVVDDESDVGSVDTKKGAITSDGDADEDHDPTKINKQIRKLISLFDRSSYVGYTATPFANVLIHSEEKAGVDKADGMMIGEGLFPRSFIISLPTPSNHVGPTKIFGQGDSEGLPIMRIVDDVEIGDSKSDFWMPSSHKISHLPRYLGSDRVPPSLRDAMLSFILAAAARVLRGDGDKHCSMLVHVTRFKDVQGRVCDQVERELRAIIDVLRDKSDGGALLAEMRALWTSGPDSFTAATEQISGLSDEALYQNPRHEWGAVEAELLRAAESIAVRKIHGDSGQDLDYDNHQHGLKVIAIGGDKLSRGLTLEGLTVSYFLRASKMYDTLMQMGRWFGYRPGYLDLCRLYTTQEMCDWFGHIADATEELREEFDRMAIQKKTPKEFGIRILSHPQMLVTSQVKMRHKAVIQVTFSGSIVETIDFHRNAEAVRNNYDATVELLAAFPSSSESLPGTGDSKARCWNQIDSDCILQFLAKYREHPAAKKVKTTLLHEYIRKEVSVGRLIDWTVMLASGSSSSKHRFAGRDMSLVKRSWYFGRSLRPEETAERREQLIKDDHYRIKRIVSPSDEKAGMTEEEVARATKRTVEVWKRTGEGKKPTRPSGTALRLERGESNGLLLLYPLDTLSESEAMQAEPTGVPTVGFAISFPFVRGYSSTVTYVVNNIYQQQELDQDV